jgi:M6 family metalloprotease-like protein
MKKTFTIFILLFVITGQLFAVPANPNPIVFTQPDGKTLTILLKGDERIHWSETLDGYTLLYNSGKYLTYARLDEDGNLQPSDFIATDIEKRDFIVLSFLNSIEKKLWFSDAQKEMILQVWQIEDGIAAMHSAKGINGVLGEYKVLCALVQFPEKSYIKAKTDFEPLFNQLGYTGNGTGSVRDFYKEASYDQFDLEISLFGIYTAPNSESYYAGPASHPDNGVLNCPELARWLALQIAEEPGINFADYTDGSNQVNFHFIFAGHGQENTMNSGHIWSHKWQITATPGLSPVCQGSKCINVYSCSPELRGYNGSNITDIGVICHEMTHAFGSADYYDTNYGTGGQYTGTGYWDLMAEGCNNSNGNRPAHPNLYVKIQFGWVTPIVLTTQTIVTDMPNSTESPVAYRINTGNGNEHYLLENMQKVGFNTNVPGSGLLIYHAYSNVGSNCINCTHPQKMYPVCASSTVAIPTGGSSSYGSINSSGCPFGNGKTYFDGTSTPKMFYWTNTVINDKPLTEITQNAATKTVSFKFLAGFVQQYTLTLSAAPSYGGTVSGAGAYDENTPVTVTATANTNYSFYNWTKNGVSVSTDTNYTFNITENTALVANFKSSNANLTSLTASSGVLTPAFSATTVNYTVDVDYEIEMISITGVAANTSATVSGNVTNSPIEVGENNFTITVTAEDSSTKDYFVKVVRAKEGNTIDNYQANSIKIYPNPASSWVNIISDNHINDIIIYDAFGKKIQEINNIGEKSYQLDVKNYVNAIYYLQIDGVTMKLMIND